jgi:hypothetical protein
MLRNRLPAGTKDVSWALLSSESTSLILEDGSRRIHLSWVSQSFSLQASGHRMEQQAWIAGQTRLPHESASRKDLRSFSSGNGPR